jgi:hypothetical protein
MNRDRDKQTILMMLSTAKKRSSTTAPFTMTQSLEELISQQLS